MHLVYFYVNEQVLSGPKRRHKADAPNTNPHRGELKVHQKGGKTINMKNAKSKLHMNMSQHPGHKTKTTVPLRPVPLSK